MTELEQEIAHLQKLRTKHRKNIHTLEETLANYGMARPLSLLNELEFEQEQLRQVEERLGELAAQVEPKEAPAVSAELKEVGRKEKHAVRGDWDVFISHAWEDKEAFARPLAKALEEEGLCVWFDEFTLRVGDSLRRSIDYGLTNSRYGTVILSPNFFAKEWPQKELDGLAAREVYGDKVILPIWHNVTADQVREYSPTLADRVAVSSDRGLEHVVEELLRVIRPASEPKVQDSSEVAQILRRYEGQRIKANREDKPDQYFVYEGWLHYLDESAAQVWEERQKSCQDLQRDEEFILDIKEIKGSPYNRLKMIEALDRIEAEETEEAERRLITISPLKQESVTSIRLPFEPEMVHIPAGKFLMGTLAEDLWAIARKYGVDRKDIAREIPWHKVPVQEFEIGKYPVTNSQYWAFVQDTGHEPPLHWEGDQYPEELGDHPVVNVTWHDAVAYCRWLQEKTDKLYRLPTEAEWEKAARGTDRREFPWGDVWDVSKCNTRDGGPSATTPVGQYSRHGDSFYGVADMAGNVWEWCADWLRAYKNNSFPDEDYGETHKVLRGSSWKTYGLARCAYRYARTPESTEDDIGFRCARG